MQKSYSPQPRRVNSKYIQQPFKISQNNLALPLTSSQLQLESGQGSAKKVKQLLQVNPRPLIALSKPQHEYEKLQLQIGNKQDKFLPNTSYQMTVENTIKEYRHKIEEQDSLIRLQEFKINRLQSELAFQKQQYQRMINKLTPIEARYNYYPQSTKITRSQISVAQIEQVPSITKIVQIDSSKKTRHLAEQIKILMLENKQFKVDLQQKFQKIAQIVNEFQQQIIEKATSLYIEQMKAQTEIVKIYQIQTNNEQSMIRQKYEALNRELQFLEQSKDVLYEKILSLL